MKTLKLLPLLLFGAILLLTGCDKDKDNDPIAVNSVVITPATLELNLGQTAQLTAKITPANAPNQNISWSSSDATVASVNSTGVVTALKAGSTTITVTTQDGGKTATCAVTVTTTTVSVTGVTLNKNATSLNVGATETLTATVNPTNATNKNVTWSSSNTAIATVSSSGVVTAKSAGTATITVTTQDGGKKATCAVTVKADTPVNPDTDIDGWGDQGNINDDVQKQ